MIRTCVELQVAGVLQDALDGRGAADAGAGVQRLRGAADVRHRARVLHAAAPALPGAGRHGRGHGAQHAHRLRREVRRRDRLHHRCLPQLTHYTIIDDILC